MPSRLIPPHFKHWWGYQLSCRFLLPTIKSSLSSYHRVQNLNPLLGTDARLHCCQVDRDGWTAQLSRWNNMVSVNVMDASVYPLILSSYGSCLLISESETFSPVVIVASIFHDDQYALEFWYVWECIALLMPIVQPLRFTPSRISWSTWTRVSSAKLSFS
jgi:hypothetical protein